MEEPFALWLFVGACGGLLGWGMLRPRRIYEYPFLFGAITSAFLIPQAIALVGNPGPVAPFAVSQVLLIGTLCLAAAWVGYQFRPLLRVQAAATPLLDLRRVQVAAVAIMVVSLLGVLGMLRFPPDPSGRGPFTIMAFFSGFSALSFPILLFLALQRGTWSSWGLAVMAGYPMFASSFLSGRRSETAAAFITIVLVLFFRRGLLPPRLAALGGVLAVAFLIPVFAEMRQEFWGALWAAEWDAIPWRESMGNVLSGEFLELRNAAAIIEATDATGLFGWGTGFWDAIVSRYVPGQLVGYDLKESLQFGWTADLLRAGGYRPHTGTTYTGLGDTYREFGWFSPLFFLAQGVLFRNLWYLATVRGAFLVQALYVALSIPLFQGLTHASVWFVQGGLILLILTYGVYRYSRAPTVRPVRRRTPDAEWGSAPRGPTGPSVRGLRR